MNTTTALVASLSLMAPSPVWAQETTSGPEPEVALICPDGSDLPCPEGVEPIPAPMEEATDEATQDEAAEDAPAGDAAAAEASETEAAETGTATAEETATDAPVEGEAVADEAVEAEAPADEVPPAETASDAPVAATDAAPADMPAEAPVIDDAAAQTAEQPVAEDSTGDVADGTEATPESGATARDADPAAEAEVAAEAEAVPDLPVQPDAASGAAPVAAAASAPDAAADAPDVTEEVVTEETARSSNEDFANKVNEAAPKKKKKKKTAGAEDDGLSDGEKAVLLGLGAVAVGALLSNNRKVELNSGDRVVVTRDDGSYQIIKDDNALLRQPGSTVRTETFADGSTRTTVTRADGSRIVTIRDAEYRVLRRAHVAPDGTETLLIDDTATVEPVDISRLPPPARAPVLSAEADEAELRAALAREAELTRRFSLAQVRDIAEVRALVPVIDLNAITFETGSAAIRPDQAQSLARLGRLIRSYVDADPREVFLIEGHTDAVGSAAYNLALSDRRAESVALALTEYFAVPPENLVVQGYGEQFLKIDTQADERLNRRASVRRITDLLRQAAN